MGVLEVLRRKGFVLVLEFEDFFYESFAIALVLIGN